MIKMFFAPNGAPITAVSAQSFSRPDIEVDDDGEAGLGSFGDFPHFEHFIIPGLGGCLLDHESDEWLESHCRLIEVDDDYDIWDDVTLRPPAWDDAIVAACGRVQRLGQALWAVDKLETWSPQDITDDPTIKGVIDNIIVGRVQAEIDTLEAQIAEYRAGRVEPTTLIEPEPVDVVDEGLALMRGGAS